jgi:formate dehydrogenase accessory protein FdhD
MFSISTTGQPAAADAAVTLADGRTWRVPAETPVAFVFDRQNYAVMMATPGDLADYAVGFALSEGIIDRVADIGALAIHHGPRGIDLTMAISAACRERLAVRQRRRNLPGSVGCGICGLDNAEELFTPLPPSAHPRLDLSAAVLTRAMAALETLQPLNRRTRSVHAAAWVDLDGMVRLVREDVGRHNALDKLLGALALADQDMATGFVLMSSRCSVELVQKAAARGVRAIAALSAPTMFALARAREAGIGIYARTADGATEIAL